jgi:pimeloyl-ACP methyl ester carboxylesterase
MSLELARAVRGGATIRVFVHHSHGGTISDRGVAWLGSVRSVRAFHAPHLDAFLRYHDIRGREPVRIYVHGLGFSSATFVGVATHPALAGRRSVLVDLLGFGLSDKPDTFGYTVEEHADSVIRLLEELELQDCELIGHSLGGSVAIVLAARRPDLVSALVVAEANLDPGTGPVSAGILARTEEEYVRDGFVADLERLRKEICADPQSMSAVTFGMQTVASPRAMYRTALSLTAERRQTFRELLEGLGVMRSFLVGSLTLDAEEKPASGEAGEGLEGAGVQRLLVSDAGHMMMFQNPDGFAETIAQALSRSA